jgi:hypothetical protein
MTQACRERDSQPNWIWKRLVSCVGMHVVRLAAISVFDRMLMPVTGANMPVTLRLKRANRYKTPLIGFNGQIRWLTLITRTRVEREGGGIR